MSPIERLHPDHAGPYRAMMLDAYDHHPDAFTSSVAERSALPLSWWEARLQEGPAPLEMVFGAFIDGQLAGVAGLSFESREKTGHKASLFGMVVQPRFRRHGLGERLVQAVLAHAAARPGTAIVQLTVSQGNQAAQGLYERCGFVVFGLEPLAVRLGPGYVAKVHMWRPVGPAVNGGDPRPGPKMSTELNKATAHEFFARFTAGDIQGALDTMTSDATWWIPGKPDRSPSAGLYSKDKIARLFHAMVKQLQSGLTMTVRSCIAEGNKVALEVASQGDLRNGRSYRQEYHMLMEFRDGKICSVREYLDTQHAYDVWLAPVEHGR